MAQRCSLLRTIGIFHFINPNLLVFSFTKQTHTSTWKCNSITLVMAKILCRFTTFLWLFSKIITLYGFLYRLIYVFVALHIFIVQLWSIHMSLNNKILLWMHSIRLKFFKYPESFKICIELYWYGYLWASDRWFMHFFIHMNGARCSCKVRAMVRRYEKIACQPDLINLLSWWKYIHINNASRTHALAKYFIADDENINLSEWF